MKLNIILHRKFSLLPTPLYSLLLCRSAPFMPECRSAYSLADYTLISFWWSQVCHHQSADMPHALAMCWSVVCMSNGGRGKLQTVLISYASHVASSTNRRYLIEILITVGTHSHTHTHAYCICIYTVAYHDQNYGALFTSSGRAVCGNHAFCLSLSLKRYYFDFVALKCPTLSASTRMGSQYYLLSCSLCVCLCN